MTTRRLALAVLLASAPVPAALQELPTSRVEIPFDGSTGHIALDVFLGADETHAFQLDTYALVPACIDRRVARRLGLETIGSTTNGDGSGTTRELDLVRLPELRVGGVVFQDVQALVDDYSFVHTASGAPIDGLLGYPLFRELLLEIDFANERIVLSRGDLPLIGPGVVANAALRERPDLKLRIGAHELVVGVDTGSASSLLLNTSFLERLKLVRAPVSVGRARTVYSEAEILGAEIEDVLVLAGREYRGVQAEFSEIFGKPLIGCGLLKDLTVTFDQRNGCALLSAASKPPGWFLEHLRFLTDEGGRWITFNDNYQSATEPYDAYAMDWEWGLGEKTAVGRMSALRDGETIATVWEFRTLWHPGEGRPVLLQFGADGTYAEGSLNHIDTGHTKSDQTFHTPQQTTYRVGHESRQLENGDLLSASFDIQPDGSWQARRSYTWVRR